MIASGVVRDLTTLQAFPPRAPVYPELKSLITDANVFPDNVIEMTVESTNILDADGNTGLRELKYGGLWFNTANGLIENFICTVIMNGTTPVSPIFNTPNVSVTDVIRMNPYLYEAVRVGSNLEQFGQIIIRDVSLSDIRMATESTTPGASGAYLSIGNGRVANIEKFGASYGIVNALQGEARVDVDLFWSPITVGAAEIPGPRKLAQKIILSRTSALEMDVSEQVEGPADIFASITQIEVDAPAIAIDVSAWISFNIR